MAKKDYIKQNLGEFLQSPESEDIEMYQLGLIKEAVQGFGQMMDQTGYHDPKSWDEDMIVELFFTLIEQAENDNSEQSSDMLSMVLDIMSNWLKFLASKNLLAISRTELDEALQELKEPIEMSEEDTYEQPNLPHWQEHTANDIDSYTDMWVTSYVKSNDWKKRQKGVTKDLLEVVLSSLTQIAYNEYRKTPKTWTKEAFEGILTGYFVSHIGLETEEYPLVVPALSGLLNYVAKQGWLNEKKAATYIRQLKDIEPEMIELAKNSNNFGPAKLVIDKMQEQGIDPEDEAAVQKFIEELNANGGIDSLLDDNVISFADAKNKHKK